MTINEKDCLLKKWWTVCAEWKNWCVVSSTDTYDTIFYMQSLWWHVHDIQEDDIRDKDIWRIERNLLYYYK